MVVNGLEMFSAWFADYKDQYVLIGGTAAAIALNEEGLQFRTTKDLDIVLHLEALTAEFAQTFWEFVKRGGYKIQQESETGQASFSVFRIRPMKNSHICWSCLREPLSLQALLRVGA